MNGVAQSTRCGQHVRVVAKSPIPFWRALETRSQRLKGLPRRRDRCSGGSTSSHTLHDLIQSRSFRQLQNAWAGEICAIATSTTAFIVVFHEDPFKGTTTT